MGASLINPVESIDYERPQPPLAKSENNSQLSVNANRPP